MKPTFLLAALLAAPLAHAADFTAGDLHIDGPYAFATAPTARAGAGYMTVENRGSAPDALIGVESELPMTQIHNTEVKDGVARMYHVDAVEIPAGGSVSFAPQQLHIMFMGLEGPLEEGSDIPVTLIFDQAGRIDVTFAVRARTSGATMRHDKHSGD